ncbi:MAG: DNA methyltransferase, partial [Chloroflexaceae bacterium]
MPYTTITTEGGLLPPDILDAVAAGELAGQRPEDFGLERTRNLSDRISAAWQAARGQWALFQTYLADLGEGETATSETREHWVVPLLRVLGYTLSRNRAAYVVEGRTYAISHRAGESEDAPPVHIESIRNSLDARPPSGRPRLSPHALVQEYLNSTEQLWGIVTNGERLRLLRDSARFTRPAYVEFDLRAMLEGEKFSEFAILYRLLHRSRLPLNGAESANCLLEQYYQQAVEAGGRVREGLRDGVEAALKRLGNGLLAHPANTELRARLAEGRLSPLDFYRQLLRLVYRLLFLMVAEERGLIAAAEAEHEGANDTKAEPDLSDLRAFMVPPPDTALRIYNDHYSIGRLRRLAETSGAGRGPFGDLWLGLLTTFRLFEGSDEAAPRRLGLAPLDGDLFSDAACADLTTNTRLANADLLAAIRALSLYRDRESKGLRRVNYGALDVEELGSVYESLLDYRPVITPQRHRDTAEAYTSETLCLSASVVKFDLVTGTERKTTGSYYTRPELVNELIKSALAPVIEQRLRAVEDHHKDTQDTKVSDPSDPGALRASVVKQKEDALLSLRVCDPACGSGHFLLAAARRLGRELAKVRAGEDQPSPSQFRRAVRDVIRSCIFGVDLNPLAVDLCKLALWIEGHCAGMPLSFLDHHIKRGNSLVGTTQALVRQGIPDEAYKPVTGDDKATASSLKKRNRQERDLALKQGMVQHDMFAAGSGAALDLAGELRAL